MKNSNIEISATEFKKHFLSLVDQVNSKHSSFVITKRKLPIAKVVPLDVDAEKNKKSYFGFLRGTVKINGDIVNFSFDSDWEINND